MNRDVPLPSPLTTLVILLGASEWPFSPDFETSEAFANSADALVEYFLNPHLFNLPGENLLNLFNSNQSPDDIDIEIGQFLDRRRSELSGSGSDARDLIIYFTGHGGFADGGSSLYLAIRRTRHINRIASSIPIVSLAHTLKQKARHLRRIVILDCCFAGAAFTVFQGQGPGQAAIAQTVDAFNVHSKGKGIPQKETSLLCSSGSKVPSLTRPGHRYTAFSDGLLHTLKSGSPYEQGSLHLYTVSNLIEDFLQANYGDEAPRPEVHSPDQSEGDVATIPFFPNIAELREQQKREQVEKEEQQALRAKRAEKKRLKKQRAREARKLKEQPSADVQVAEEASETENPGNVEVSLLSHFVAPSSDSPSSLPTVASNSMQQVVLPSASESPTTTASSLIEGEELVPLSLESTEHTRRTRHAISVPVLAQMISEELNLASVQVERTIDLLDSGNTIPFIARYRKEMTNNLDEVQIEAIFDRTATLRELDRRKLEVYETIDRQEKLTPELSASILNATTLQEVEDLYIPYHHDEETPADLAREKGLAPLAELILQQPALEGEQNAIREECAQSFLSAEKGVDTSLDAYTGACEIVAESISEDAEVRSTIRETFSECSTVEVEAADPETISKKDPKGTYERYYEFNQEITRLAPHQILALNRAEQEGVLHVGVTLPYEQAQPDILQYYPIEPSSPFSEMLAGAMENGYTQLLAPAIARDVREEMTRQADEYAINIFAINLRNLLLQPPFRGKKVLGIDPAYRTGCKLAVVNETGQFLEADVIYLHQPEQARQSLHRLLERYSITVIAIGNGTASRETERMVVDMIVEFEQEAEQRERIGYAIVDEAGASVYSASQVARQEFPKLDLTLRSAISIARRLQDPLSELVKIDPKSLGVGLYQHDVDQEKLKAMFDRVVRSCVNFAGVDVNSASAMLLKYVSGISESLAEAIVKYREQHGPFSSREDLRKVPSLDSATFVQAAGFLKITNGVEPLDNTFIHPESYPAARAFLEMLSSNGDGKTDKISQRVAQFRRSFNDTEVDNHRVPVGNGSIQQTALVDIAERLGIGLPTLNDIMENLEKPGLDPRDALPAPILRRDVVEMEDLQPGMVLQGTVRNVVPFGAYIDIGVKENGMVHISELPEGLVREPLKVLKVGQIVQVRVVKVEIQRQRVELSMKSVNSE